MPPITHSHIHSHFLVVFIVNQDGAHVSTRRLSQDHLQCRKAWTSTGSDPTIVQGGYQVSSKDARTWCVQITINVMIIDGELHFFSVRERHNHLLSCNDPTQVYAPKSILFSYDITLTNPRILPCCASPYHYETFTTILYVFFTLTDTFVN